MSPLPHLTRPHVRSLGSENMYLRAWFSAQKEESTSPLGFVITQNVRVNELTDRFSIAWPTGWDIA
jgi:hypothetical protein